MRPDGDRQGIYAKTLTQLPQRVSVHVSLCRGRTNDYSTPALGVAALHAACEGPGHAIGADPARACDLPLRLWSTREKMYSVDLEWASLGKDYMVGL